MHEHTTNKKSVCLEAIGDVTKTAPLNKAKFDPGWNFARCISEKQYNIYLISRDSHCHKSNALNKQMHGD